MKKTLILCMAFCAALPVSADLNGNGYYRVQNLVTERYVSVVDNRGSVNFVTTTADLQAIALDKRFDVVSSDAASVLYIDKIGSQYNISSQGTSVHEIIDHYVDIEQNGSANGEKLYMAYGTYDGVVRYLGDGNNTNGNLGMMSITTSGNYRKWYIKPIEADGDNYFGAAPDISAAVGDNSGLYTTLYASFPCAPYSDDVKLYTVNHVGEWGAVTLKEIEGVVPAGTPIIVKCSGEKSSDNRLTVGGDGVPTDVNPSFKGVYFNCDIGGHINRVAYDRDTMRVLGVCEDGSLGFVQSSIDYIPANTTYLTVPAGSPSEFKFVSEDEFAGVDNVGINETSKAVFTITGIKVSDGMNVEELRSLPSGVYIIGGKKTVVR